MAISSIFVSTHKKVNANSLRSTKHSGVGVADAPAYIILHAHVKHAYSSLMSRLES